MPINSNRRQIMEYRKLGNTDLKLSVIGFGCWAMGGGWGQTDDRESIAAVRRALDLGVNFFDTADILRI
jgi:aryl-alcohol dehydrogenase-like predicted oxidoreductase